MKFSELIQYSCMTSSKKVIDVLQWLLILLDILKFAFNSFDVDYFIY